MSDPMQCVQCVTVWGMKVCMHVSIQICVLLWRSAFRLSDSGSMVSIRVIMVHILSDPHFPFITSINPLINLMRWPYDSYIIILPPFN